MDQWVECLARSATEEEVPKVDWIIVVFTGTKKDYVNPDPGIKSWAKPVGSQKGIITNR